MAETIWSRHAKKRCAQRAIPEFHIQLLKLFGDCVEQKGGSSVLELSNDNRVWLRQQLADALAHWDQRQAVYAVFGENGCVITTGHRHRVTAPSRRGRDGGSVRWRRTHDVRPAMDMPEEA